jgi:HD-GYP domain-containing protein (c-di-GMP phosphodiesterase class II)
MRARLHATLATIGLGFAILIVAGLRVAEHPLTAVALFAAAAIGAELWQWSGDDFASDGTDERPFALAVPVQLAAAIVIGPWAAALVAGVSVLAVRRLRESAWPVICLRAVLGATSSLAAGFAFELAGGHVGHPALPADLMPVLALGLAYFVVYRFLLTAALPWNGIQTDSVVAAGETGLGVVLALFAARHAWNLLALAPIGLLVDQAHTRLVSTRREVASALETFATIVDERDPYTYRHSARVAAYVAELAEAIGLPPAEVARLRWAGRLHDLGKVAVDASVLRKPGRLDEAEWAAVHRAPRLSARLLHRFRFAARQAQAVEYQHERFDGAGYYGIAGDELPLASHFLIVADSFDAMTTDRPFRERLTKDAALEEIEQNAGTQFHPTIARAFIAVQRGQPIEAALEESELAGLREAALPYGSQRAFGLGELRRRPELAAVAGAALALLGAGVGQLELVAAGAAAAGAGLVLRALRRLRSSRLVEELRQAVAASTDRLGLFEWVAAAVGERADLNWAGLIAFDEHGLGGVIELQQGSARPREAALLSWLVREAQADEVVISAGGELGSEGTTVTLPLRRENSALVGFVVFMLGKRPGAFVELALGTCLGELGLAFAEQPHEPVQLAPRHLASAR